MRLDDHAFRDRLTALKPILLDRGISATWKSLILTHAAFTDKNDTSEIQSSQELTGADLLGEDLLANMAFEQVSVAYEFSLASTSRDSRKENGQYFTPQDVSKFMAQQSMGLGKEGIWLDPCSSIGSLGFELVNNSPEPLEMLLNRMKFVDMDDLSLLIGRGLMSLRFNSPGLFGALKENFYHADYLANTQIPEHDFVIMNPPYVEAPSPIGFESASSRDMYAFFLERVAKTSKGFVAIVPQSFTNGRKFRPLRSLMLREMKSLDVYCFDNVPDNIFKGFKYGSPNTNKANSTRASIIVASRDGTQGLRRRITPMLRWRASERNQLFTSAPDFLTENELSPRKFPKVSQALSPLYDEAKLWLPLESIVSRSETQYCLRVPSTPRYFISAVKIPLNRSSMKTLFFDSIDEMNMAYLVLNSSLAYWWWRVNDGGMTLSESTLMSTPIPPEMEISATLLEMLETSETKNLVKKLNSGKFNENVKHPPNLIDLLNKHLCPKFAEGLIREHNNSVFSTSMLLN